MSSLPQNIRGEAEEIFREEYSDWYFLAGLVFNELFEILTKECLLFMMISVTDMC